MPGEQSKENEEQPKSSGVTETENKEITRKNQVEEQLQDHKTPSKNF